MMGRNGWCLSSMCRESLNVDEATGEDLSPERVLTPPVMAGRSDEADGGR